MSDDVDDYRPRGAREARSLRGGAKRHKSEIDARRPRAEKSPMRRQIERGMNGDTAGNVLSTAIARAIHNMDRKSIDVARQLMYGLEKCGSLIFTTGDLLASVVDMARHHRSFVRDPARYVPTGATASEQLRRFAGHLFEKWSVPSWLDDVWTTPVPEFQKWFIHLGAGRNLSTAPSLSFPITKRMAHFAVNAPRGLTPVQSLRWGQCRGLDIPEELAAEICQSRLAGALPEPEFWRSVLGWFAVHPEIYGHVQEIVDYLFAMRIGDFVVPPMPNYSMRGRTPDRLLADSREWHRQFQRRHRRRALVADRWRTCGIPGFMPTLAEPVAPGATRPEPEWVIEEILTYDRLIQEGDVMHHCVATYVDLAEAGSCAIYSLRRRERGELRSTTTIEIRPATRHIVQARAIQNAMPSEDDRKLIAMWAKMNGLVIESYVFPHGR